MRVWRLTRRIHSQEPLSGLGAAKTGNRWNSPGVRVAYTSSSRPLAVLEMLVHVTRDTVPDDPVLMALQVPDSLIGEVASLPADWSGLPYSPGAQRLGDRWVQEGRCVALLVPSVVLPAERNLLLNPEHPDFRRVKILESEAFVFDRRLLR